MTSKLKEKQEECDNYQVKEDQSDRAKAELEICEFQIAKLENEK